MGEEMGGAGAMSLVLALLAGYGLGSIPFGLLLTRWAGAGDIRTIGSGNIGATNVLRTGRKGLALATLLLDLAKGAIPTAVGLAWLGPLGAVLGGAGAIIGHCFPVWLGFRGGKGVATAAGVVLGLTPMLFVLILVVVHRRRLGHPLGIAGLDGRGLPGAGGGVGARQRLGGRALPARGGAGGLQAPREHRAAAQGRGEPAQLWWQACYIVAVISRFSSRPASSAASLSGLPTRCALRALGWSACIGSRLEGRSQPAVIVRTS